MLLFVCCVVVVFVCEAVWRVPWLFATLRNVVKFSGEVGDEAWNILKHLGNVSRFAGPFYSPQKCAAEVCTPGANQNIYGYFALKQHIDHVCSDNPYLQHVPYFVLVMSNDSINSGEFCIHFFKLASLCVKMCYCLLTSNKIQPSTDLVPNAWRVPYWLVALGGEICQIFWYSCNAYLCLFFYSGAVVRDKWSTTYLWIYQDIKECVTYTITHRHKRCGNVSQAIIIEGIYPLDCMIKRCENVCLTVIS